MDVYEEGIKSGFEGARVGFGGFGIDAYKKGQKVDPKVQAAYNLNKTLEKYPDFTKDLRTQIQNEYVNFPDIQFVNLETFASVLNFLRQYPNPTPNEFRDEVILEYFSRILPDKVMSVDDKARLILRLKAQFIKYIVAIKSFQEKLSESGIEYEREDFTIQEGLEERLEESEEEKSGTKYGEEEYEDE